MHITETSTYRNYSVTHSVELCIFWGMQKANQQHFFLNHADSVHNIHVLLSSLKPCITGSWYCAFCGNMTVLWVAPSMSDMHAREPHMPICCSTNKTILWVAPSVVERCACTRTTHANMLFHTEARSRESCLDSRGCLQALQCSFVLQYCTFVF